MQHAAAALLCFTVAATSVLAVRGDELTAIEGCTLVDAPWADGDSFPVRTPDGQMHTVRLYGADCLEKHVAGETDARRLRAQRRYFGITAARPDPAESIALAKDIATQASAETRRFLRKPFSIHTSFADARGDGKHKRIYAFVFDAAGEDLAAHLVSAGLARAYGVSRSTRTGESADDYREFLADRELPAGFLLDPTTAAREDLMRLPRVGEALANRIIERRPYRRLTDLLEVDGIGPATYRELKPFLRFGSAD